MAKKLRTEAPMDFGDNPERPSPGIQQRLAAGETIFQGNPAIPQVPGESSYLEKNASQRFAEVIQMARRFTGRQNLSSESVIRMLAKEMMNDVQKVIRLEMGNPETMNRLVNFAIDIIQKEYNIDDCSYLFDVEFVDLYGIPASQFRTRPETRQQQPDDDEDEEEENETPDFSFPSFEMERTDEDFELEKHKRQIINALIQGSAKKFHWIILDPSVKSALDAIDPDLQRTYAKIMATNDLLYWSMDDMIQAMSSSGQGAGGSAEANFDEEEGYPEWNAGQTYNKRDIVSYNGVDYLCQSPQVQSQVNPEDDDTNWCPKPQVKLTVRATTFVIMVHELGKAVESALAKFGLPEDPVTAADVMGQTDTMMAEPDQLRLGPKMVEKMRTLLPDEIFAEDAGDLHNWFKMYFYRKPAEEFLLLVKNVLSENPRDNEKAKREFEYILAQAKKAREGMDTEDDDEDDEDYGDDETPTLPTDDGDDGFDDLDDFLSSMGIGPSK
jgi:hypothetical protein